METFSALLALCVGNSPVTSEFPAQRPVTRSFDVFFDLRLNKRMSKQGEAGDLRRHLANYDVIVMSTSFSTFHSYSMLWQQWQNNDVQSIINSWKTKKREIWFMDCFS